MLIPLKTTTLTIVPAIKTPIMFALENFFLGNPSKNAAKAPVYTPEPGKGIPINIVRPKAPYFFTYFSAFF